MGKCYSTSNQPIVAHQIKNAPKIEYRQENKPPECQMPVKQEPVKPQEIHITIKLCNIVAHEGMFSSDAPVSNTVDSVKNKLEGESDYDVLVKDENITSKIGEPLSSFFPGEERGEITLVYTGLDLPKDIRMSCAESTHFLSLPKFETDPFEIILFDKTDSNISYFFYKNAELLEMKKFNYFSAFCNGRDKLFISGGEKNSDDKEYQNLFVEIDLLAVSKKENHMKKLPSLIQRRCWHSMIFIPSRYVFIVGGLNTKSVELYDIETMSISLDSELNEARSEATLCCANNSCLYAFGGFLMHNSFLNSIEKCNLRSAKRQWNMIQYSLANDCKFVPSFFAVTYYQDNSLILFGVNELSQFQKTGESLQTYRNYTFDYVTEMISYFDSCEPLSDICQEKCFLPISVNTSVLIPLALDCVKIYHFSDLKLNVRKYEEIQNDTTLDEIQLAGMKLSESRDKGAGDNIIIDPVEQQSETARKGMI